MKDAYYFPHDSNARTDEKSLYIRSKYGIEGYGLYWMLIECMHEQADGKLTCDLLDGLAMSFNIDITLLRNFYNDAIKVKLFVTDNEKYWSDRVLRNKKELEKKRKQKSKAGKKGMAVRWNKDNSVITEDNTVITEDNKGKESKVNEIKEKESKENDIVTPESFYHNNFGLITPFIAQDILNYIDDGVEEKLIIKAMEVALANNVRKWSYVNAILNNCINNNIKTLEQFQAHKLEEVKKYGATGTDDKKVYRLPKSFYAPGTFDD